jgi:hypothetical protein
MGREYTEHTLCIGCPQPRFWLVCITYGVMTKLMRQAESPATWISRTVNDSDSKITDLNIRSIARIGPERDRESQEAQPLTYGLKVVYRALL